MSEQIAGSPAQWLDQATSKAPDSIALLLPEGAINFGELKHSVSRFCDTLLAKGVRPGSVLAVLCHSRRLLALLLYAAPRMGVTLFPLNPELTREQQKHLLSQVGCEMLVTDEPFETLASIPANGLMEFVERDVPISLSSLDSAEIHLLVATSGTLGQPKAVMLSGNNIAAAVRASRKRISLVRKDRWLCCLPLFHIGGISILYRCLEAGAAVVLNEKFDPVLLFDDLKRHQVTHLSLVPAMLSRLLDACDEGPPPSELRVVLLGGGPLDPQLARRAYQAGWPLCTTYGMTETASQLATDCSKAAGLERGLVGRPLDGFELKVTAGHAIRVRGAAVMAGYANPELRPGDGLQNGWFETGDLGQLDGVGRLKILGRADDMLVTGGINIHPQEVESRISQYPGVEAVVVTACPDVAWGDRLVAWVVGEIDQTALVDWCRQTLPGAMRPREIYRLASLPLTTTGKIDRSVLHQRLLEKHQA